MMIELIAILGATITSDHMPEGDADADDSTRTAVMRYGPISANSSGTDDGAAADEADEAEDDSADSARSLSGRQSSRPGSAPDARACMAARSCAAVRCVRHTRHSATWPKNADVDAAEDAIVIGVCGVTRPNSKSGAASAAACTQRALWKTRSERCAAA